MSALPLFYAPDLSADRSQITLDGAEAVHMVKARRLREGDQVLLTNGAGGMAQAVIAEVTERGKAVRLQVENHTRQPAPKREIRLYVAMPKGDRQTTLIDMATQLGVSAIVPLNTRYSVVKPNEKAMARWQRQVLEAAKQSRRAWFPVVTPPLDFFQALEQATSESVCVVLDQRGKPLSEMAGQLNTTAVIPIFIGPEGGFSDEELTALRTSNALEISVGAHILRIETAAVAIIAALNSSLS